MRHDGTGCSHDRTPRYVENRTEKETIPERGLTAVLLDS